MHSYKRLSHDIVIESQHDGGTGAKRGPVGTDYGRVSGTSSRDRATMDCMAPVARANVQEFVDR